MRKNRMAAGENWLCYMVMVIIEKGSVLNDTAFFANIFYRGTFCIQCGTSG